jgi:hypothetical protein
MVGLNYGNLWDYLLKAFCLQKMVAVVDAALAVPAHLVAKHI